MPNTKIHKYQTILKVLVKILNVCQMYKNMEQEKTWEKKDKPQYYAIISRFGTFVIT